MHCLDCGRNIGPMPTHDPGEGREWVPLCEMCGSLGKGPWLWRFFLYPLECVIRSFPTVLHILVTVAGIILIIGFPIWYLFF